jgi:hypothetical protein
MTGILLRVFNRIEDVSICVELIRKYWVRDTYHLLVVGNGKSAGFPIPEAVRAQADNVVELDQNLGHFKGNAQQILAGIPHLPDTCAYTILLEADTWVCTDELVQKYIHLLDSSAAVWASSEWVEKYWSLGLDLAIVKTAYIKSHPEMFDYTVHAESWVCNYLLDHQQRFQYIPENMPVHIPKSLRFWYNPYGGRFRSFPKAQMVTHHIEDLEQGLETKKLLANICLGRREFPVGADDIIRREHRKLKMILALAKYMPRSRWIRKKQKRNVEC